MVYRVPLELKELNGAYLKNPKRKPRGRPPKSEHPLGEPPNYFSTTEQLIWAEIQQNAPATVLTRADRHHVEILCRLMAKFRERKETSNDVNHLMKCLQACGFTPIDRQRLTTRTDAPTESPFNEFTQ